VFEVAELHRTMVWHKVLSLQQQKPASNNQANKQAKQRTNDKHTDCQQTGSLCNRQTDKQTE
jgi:hypothetical protein